MKKVLPVALSGLFAVVVLACGPELTPAFLHRPREILRAPERWLGLHIRSIVHPPRPPARLASPAQTKTLWKTPLSSTLEVDVNELRHALTATGCPAAEAGRIAEDYQNLRFNQLSLWEDAEHRTLPSGELLDRLRLNAPAHHPWLKHREWPEVVPADFRLYAEGAQHLYEGNWNAARASWQKVLALPPGGRKHRAAWAAWMLYKTAPTMPDATAALEKVCDVIEREGCGDSLRMHPAALSQLARLKHDPVTLARLALDYHNARANERSLYLGDLMTTVRNIVSGPDSSLIEEAVKDASAREIITRVLASEGEWQSVAAFLGTWAAALEKAGVTSDPVLADLAIALYRWQQYDLARKFIVRGSSTWETLWIRAKLDLQCGNRAAAAVHMAEALRKFPVSEKGLIMSSTESWYYRNENPEPLEEDCLEALRNSRFLADNAALRLNVGDFATALKLFLDADCPHDAAYVAEHLMSEDELIQFIREHRLKRTVEDGNVPERFPDRRNIPPFANRQAAVNTFLYVAARRLAREHWFKAARPLMPPTLLPLFDRYVELYRAGRSDVLKADVRARSLMEAARIHRWQGMELFGAEGEPDATVWEGQYGGDRLPQFREAAYQGKEYPEWNFGVNGGQQADTAVPPLPLPPIDEEMQRLHHNMLWHKPRFHYRYDAAELAWQAAHLLPKECPEAAAMLAEGGSWISETAPKEADRFYKELVWRHWSTDLARQADKKRWFPAQVYHRYDLAELLERPLPWQQ